MDVKSISATTSKPSVQAPQEIGSMGEAKVCQTTTHCEKESVQELLGNRVHSSRPVHSEASSERRYIPLKYETAPGTLGVFPQAVLQ